jgi:lactoylglutathione lyase
MKFIIQQNQVPLKTTILSLIIIFFSFEHTIAQSGNRPVLNHIAVYVSNLEVSSAFYQDIIGLEMIDEPFKDGKHSWFSLGTAGQLHLISGASNEMEQIKDRHLCFSVLSIEKFIKNLEKNKIVFTNWKGDSRSPTVRPDGVKQVYFQDPDGYWIEINDDQN